MHELPINKNKMSISKKQHWVPRFYLKQFAIPETKDSKIPKVWAFSKEHRDLKEPAIISILDAASSRFMYSPLDDEGNRDFNTDRKLTDLEELISKRWIDMCYDFSAFSGSARKIISLFLATIMLRDQKSFNLIKRAHNNFRSFLDSLPKDDLGIPQVNKFIHKGKEYDIDLSDWRDIKYGSDNYIRQIFVDTINENSLHFAKILLSKTWSIRTFSKPILATSDAPFIMCNTTKEKYGIGTKGTIVFFPLTPYRALEIGGTGKDNVCYPMSDEYAHLINYLLWTNDCRFLYSHRNTDEVLLEIHSFVETQKKELSTSK
jgi:hypothetical protein